MEGMILGEFYFAPEINVSKKVSPIASSASADLTLKKTESETVAVRQWAVSVRKTGLPNFYKVSDELYRGAQPEKAGFQELKKMGIRTVVNLRSFHSDRDNIEKIGFAYEHIYAKAWHPEDKEIVRFLRIVGDKKRTPVFVHCQHGADRTGIMVAAYRIAICGWSKEEAIKEMTEGGFGFHPIWENLIQYVRDLDFERIKSEAGL
jgi:protein tyrosine phosphatase (PTP) superfamily phosphohydrolase (DUF442 family)